MWCVTEKNTGDAAGYSGFQFFDDTPAVEIVFAFLKKFWGNGFTTEAAKACLRYWFEELNTNKMFAAACPENIASCRVLEKNGMSFFEKSAHYEMDLITYSISRDDFEHHSSFYKLTHSNFSEKINLEVTQSN